MIGISRVTADKTKYMPLLLIGDEQEDMVMKYLDGCELYVMHDDGKVCAACAVTDEGGGVLEIKNISVYPEFQRRGLGRKLIDYISAEYSGRYRKLTAGTGDSPLTVPFYEACGFVRAGVVPDFFIKNYDHPIIECGVLLRAMIYFEKAI